MIAGTRSLKDKHLELENNLKKEKEQPLADDFVAPEIKIKKLQIEDPIIKLARQKSGRGKKRYRLQTNQKA